MADDAKFVFDVQDFGNKVGPGEIKIVRRQKAESRAWIALGEQVFLGVVKGVPAFSARPYESAD